jgi:signal peptidase II
MLLLAAMIAAITLVAIDHITKYWALTYLKPLENTTVIKGLLDFTFVENRGAAFGFLSGQRWLFVIITIIVSLGIIYTFIKLPKNKVNTWIRFSLLLIFAGAIGNFVDRIYRGYVVDFLEVTFISFPVFNVADIYVVIGTGILMFIMLFVLKDEPKKEKDKS